MLDAGQLRTLNVAGVAFQSSESPALWTHLESRIFDSTRIGSKFAPLASDAVAKLIADGESALLGDMAAMLRDTGRIGRVTHVLNLPYLVGTEAVRSMAAVNPALLLELIQSPGLPDEHRIQVIATLPDDIPCTNTVTVEGGLYADGHTAGYFTLYPGDGAAHGRHEDGDHVYLATASEIRRLAAEMLERAEDATSLSPTACAAMATRALKALD